MSKEMKLIPELRFPEFDRASEWQLQPLRKVLIKNSKKNKSLKHNLVQSVSNKHGFINQEDYFDNRRVASKDTSNYYVIKKGYFAYNPSRIDVGSLAYQHENITSIISPLYVSFQANYEEVDDIFLLNWFFSDQFSSQLIFEGGVRNTLSYENLVQINITLPSIPEQQKIASCLSSLDELIAAHKDKLDALKDHKKGLLQNLFPQEGESVPKVRFPEFEGDGEWVEKKLIDTTDKKVKWSFTGGPFGSNLKANDYTTEGIRIIQLQNIGDGMFNDDNKIYTSIEKADELLSCNIYAGDIIISKMGDPVGRACIIPNNLERCVMASDGIRLVVDENKFSKYFIYSLLNSKRIRKTIQSKSTGSTRKRIGLNPLRETELIVPKDLKEQQKIASCLSAVDELIIAQQEKIDELQQHKKGLMQGLFPKIER